MEILALHNLQIAPRSKRKKRRVGRGNASGKGNYSGRGMKGQKARAGGRKKLALRGVKNYLRRIPKVRGFKGLEFNRATVNISALNQFADGQEITPTILLKRGLIKSTKTGVKILGSGQLNKKLIVKANQFSKTAKHAILKAGGRAEIIPAQKNSN